MSLAPKGKLKRSRDSSSESHNSSLIKNVTSRVAGLLPARIQKWFSPTQTTSNGSAVTADSSDSSTEEDGEEVVPAPSKRMRYSHYGQNKFDSPYADVNTLSESKAYDIVAQIEGNISYSGQSTSEGCSTYSTIQSPPGRSTFRCETQYVSTPLTRPQEDSAVETTSRNFNTKYNTSLAGTSVGSIRQPITEKETFKNKNQDESNLKSCVKTTQNKPREKRNLRYRPSMLGSPFYPGHTMYGGASSTYINQPNIKNHVVPVVNKSNDTTTNEMSQAARRVMDLLENYSSPLVEARRIPHYTKPSLETLMSRSSSSTSQLDRKKDSKYQELYVPTMATFLRMKQRNRLMDSTAAARQLMASHSSTTGYNSYHIGSKELERAPVDKEPGKFNPKLKSRVTRKRGETELESETLPTLDLPSGGLNIDRDNMPNFSFGNPPDKPNNQPSSASTISQLPAVAAYNVKQPSKENVFNGAFKFSSPIKLSTDQPEGDGIVKYMFGSPEKSLHKQEEKTGEKKVETQKNWQCPDCWVHNKADVQKCVCCGGQMPSSQPEKPAKCTTCKFANSQPNKDKCINCEKIPALITMNNIGTSKNETSKWKCEDCWVMNKSEDEKCVACGGMKAGAKKENNNSIKAISVIKPLVNASAKPQGDWRCDDCWVNNKSDVNKCVACGGAKPSTNTETSTKTLNNTDSTFSNLVKSQLASKWQCSCCQVANDNERATCICCEAAKPGTIKETEKKMFNFGAPSNTSFKFGITNNEVATSAEKSVTVDSAKPITSEANNNTLPKTPSFSFGMSSVQKSGSDDAKVTPKLGFTFGSPKNSAVSKTSETPTFTFGSKPKTTEVSKPLEEKDREQEVPSVNVNEETSKSNLGSIKLPMVTPSSLQTSNLLSTPSAATLAVSTTTSSEAKLTLTHTTTTSETKQKTFTFSAGSDSKLNSTLFGSTTTPSTKLITFTPVESDLKTTAPVVSKAETATSVFQSSDSTANIANTATAKAVFNFGSGTTSTPQTDSGENRKLNFSFGSNKTDSSMFKPAFNASGDSTTKFTLPTSSPANPSTDASVKVNSTPNNIFSSSTQKESWQLGSNNNPNNGLNTSTATNALQKGAFTFGSSTSFNAGSTLGGISFGASTTNSASTFGSTVTNATPAFGSSTTSTTPAFGGTPNAVPAFGSGTTSAPSFGSGTIATPTFGTNATNAPAFGSGSTNATPTFGSGTTNATPAFGSVVANTTPAFGSATTNATPAFGSGKTNTTPAFGGVTTNATPAFGSTNATPTFGSGTTNATPTFGSGTANATPTFGSGTTNTPTFGSTTAPAFGNSNANPTPTFGSTASNATTFGVNSSSTPAFGGSTAPFGASSTPAPAFGSSTQPAFGGSTNVFGMQNQNASSTGMFSSTPMFGNNQPSGGLFGSPSVAAAPTFGSANTQQPFDSMALPSTPAPAFNFGAPQNSGVFSFGQQQPPGAGVYNFGSAPGPTPVKFNMGTGPQAGAPTLPTMRRIRKPRRTITPR